MLFHLFFFKNLRFLRMISGVIRNICRRSTISILSSRLTLRDRITPLTPAAYLLQSDRFYSATASASGTTSESPSRTKSAPLTQIETKIALGFTCKPCGERVNRLISRVAYKKGLVLVRCPGCKNVHLIADNIGWFKDLAPGIRNVEEILTAKGESVRKHLEEDEVFETEDIPTEVSQKFS